MLRRQILILALGLVCAFSAPAQAQHTAADTLRTVVPGLVYREYSIVIGATNNDWRVTDPNATNPGHPGNAPSDYLPNPVLGIPVDDLLGALKVVAIMDVWGGHVGTTGKRFRLNGNDWIGIPDITDTTEAPECYTHQQSVAVEVPLGHLIEGANSLEGTSSGQTCNSFDWGQWGWYSFLLRVYYDPAQKTPPTGSIIVPVSGAILGDDQGFEVSASSEAGISVVDFVGYYEDHDYDGDGVYLDWQQSYHRLVGDGAVTLRGHLGTAYYPPYRTTWNTQWVPDQATGGIKAVARIRDATGLWIVTDQVSNLTLSRPDVDVRLYKGGDVPTNFWVRAGQTKSSSFAIPAEDSLALALSARMFVATWNGSDQGASQEETHSTRVNGWTAPAFGAGYFYSHDGIDIPVDVLHDGTNTVSFFSATAGHGVEILWPGPAVTVRFAKPAIAPPTIVAQPVDAFTIMGLAASFSVTVTGSAPITYVWQRNGVDIPGATNNPYTTPPTLATDDGAGYRCIVSNPYGEVASDVATLTVGAPLPRVTEGLLALYTFRESGGSTVNDVSGVGVPLDLSIADPDAITWMDGGLRVDTATLISSPAAATKVIAAVRTANSVTVEAWITPANTTQMGPARIVSVSGDSANRNLTLGQGLYGSLPSALFDVRLRTTATSLNGQPDLSSPDGSLQVSLTHVVYTRDSGGTARIFVDGVQRAVAVVGGDLSNWDEGYRLLLANEITGDRPWLGEFHLVAIYDRALSPEQVLRNFAVGIPAPGVAGVDPDGLEPVPGGDPLPREFTLEANYPNPFNPRTTIAFDLPAPSVVSLRVYDVSGRLVDVLLADEAMGAGRNEVAWQGRDTAGRVVSAGIYFYRLDAGDFSATKRMTLIK